MPESKPNLSLILWSKLLTSIFILSVGIVGIKPWLEGVLEPVVLGATNPIREGQIDKDALPVIVGIDHLYTIPGRPANSLAIAKLFENLEEAASEGNRPIAIGFDIDLSYNKRIYPPEHIKLIEEAEAFHRHTGVPVYFGVGQEADQPSQSWLPPVDNLDVPTESAAMIRPLPDTLERYPDYYLRDAAPATEKLYSLGSKLSLAYFGWRAAKAASSHENYVAPSSELIEHHLSNGTIAEYYIDYSVIRDLAATTITCKLPTNLKDPNDPFDVIPQADRPKLANRVLIIGKATTHDSDLVAFDKVISPVETGIFRGVYVHGCAFYSRAIRPIRLGDGPGFFVLEILSLLGAACCSIAKLTNFKHSRSYLAEHFVLPEGKRDIWSMKIAAWGGYAIVLLSLVAFQAAILSCIIVPNALPAGARAFIYVCGAASLLLAFQVVGQHRSGHIVTNERLGESLLGITRWGFAVLGIGTMLILLNLQSRILWIGFLPSVVYLVVEPQVSPLFESAIELAARLAKGQE